MSSYLDVLKDAIIFFPLVAFFISVPFILSQYHKFGSISFFKALVIYSFVLYFICAYFLIILPLPNPDKVALLTTPRVQLIPFKFIIDFVTHTSFNISIPSTYLKMITESYFYVPIYNLLLTMPFGIYLRYYFNCNLKKVTLYTFLLSLFFELTQLSGLYFIYERSYRLFDIDDLILNTIGGILGYLISNLFIKYLPKREKLDKAALKKGKEISGFKRTTSFILDFVLFMLIYFIFSYLIHYKYLFYIVLFIYYVLISFILNGSTLGEKFINLRIIKYNNKNNIFNLFLRKFMFILIYFVFPYFLFFAYSNINNINEKLKIGIGIFLIGFVFLIYAISIVKYLFTNKPMLYEKISKTKMISTIKETI